MTKTLASHVHVRHPEGGEVHRFAPGEQVPQWAHELIPNPKAWAGGSTSSAEEHYAPQAAVVPSDAEEETPAGTGSGATGEIEAPPKGARRTGRQTNPPKA